MSTTTSTSTYNTTTRHTLARRPGRSGITTASTPNLNQLYTAQSSRLVAPALSRKGSVAALTQNSLAAIPDDSEGYAYNSVLTSDTMPPPLTPGRPGGSDEITIGDTVEVPGSMTGTVRFIGPVAGRKGTFAGVELHPDYAPRGKNSGDVDGVYYFTTTQPGAGIFLPLSKAIKRDSPSTSGKSFPHTPASGGLKVASQNSINYTPPTPGLPKLSQSVGPGRAPSPLGKKTRPSLPRPESPVRRLMTPGPRPTIATPAVPARFGSPTSSNKFAQSVRGTAGDPSKRMPGHVRKGSVGVGPRSVSALGTTSNPNMMEDDVPPMMGVQRTQTNGSMGSVSSFSLKVRPASRAASRVGNHAHDEEVERLRAELEERDRQLKEQAATLAEMESSLTELQGLIENSEGPPLQRRNSLDDKDSAQLRALVREKNDKIAMLTAEFDAHRADFRSTIDTLEMASAETERVYEKRIEELMQEIQELQDRTSDVDTIAAQLKQLEELVQELEEGLEDARRGEAEARGEVEFLRGEVERTRTELRREREKVQSAMNGVNGSANGGAISKELEQKEDEIRGLKAIIHSLSRDSVPKDNPDRIPTQRPSSFRPGPGESIEERLTREKLDREVAELRALLESKTAREEELERELEALRRGSVMTALGRGARASSLTIGGIDNDRSSIRDSRGTVVAPPSTSNPESQPQHKGLAALKQNNRGQTLDTMHESDTYSTATENSTLWCEICETAGHDILTCTNVFGAEHQQPNGDAATAGKSNGVQAEAEREYDAPDIKPAPLSPLKTAKPPLATAATTTPSPAPAPVLAPNLMDSGPVAGKESGTVDAGKWCAICERDGHDSLDCPFENAF
ncbi:hypothetical protein C8A03DRAFT_42583 [Achaetomium macrosporum]|uniref:CAP-Gly domain-containing protein n=1 Tax=Achaetomium macrosporum TaxID=79813 RepID=A0AAN7CD19_9PEZI|nr:hypothetical protein C8A03DRAFT_42583 [Achaetomium macrosporum]